MNPEVLQDLYDRAVSKGYGKSKDEFSALLQTNQSVFDDNYSYVKSKGYNKSADEFGTLVGKKKSTTAGAANLTPTGAESVPGLPPTQPGNGSSVSPSGDVTANNPKVNVRFNAKASPQPKTVTGFTEMYTSAAGKIIKGDKSSLTPNDVEYITDELLNKAKSSKRYDADFFGTSTNGGVNKDYATKFLKEGASRVTYNDGKPLTYKDIEVLNTRWIEKLGNQKVMKPHQVSSVLNKVWMAQTKQDNPKLYAQLNPPVPQQVQKGKELKWEETSKFAGYFDKELLQSLTESEKNALGNYLNANPGVVQKMDRFGYSEPMDVTTYQSTGSIKKDLQKDIISQALGYEAQEAASRLQVYKDQGDTEKMKRLNELQRKLTDIQVQQKILEKSINQNQFDNPKLTPEQQGQLDMLKSQYQVLSNEYENDSKDFESLKQEMEPVFNQMKTLEASMKESPEFTEIRSKLEPVFKQLDALKTLVQQGNTEAIIRNNQLVEYYKNDFAKYEELANANNSKVLEYERLVKANESKINLYNERVNALIGLETELNTKVKEFNTFVSSNNPQQISKVDQYKTSIEKYNALVREAGPLYDEYTSLYSQIGEPTIKAISEDILKINEATQFEQRMIAEREPSFREMMLKSPVSNKFADYTVFPLVAEAAKFTSQTIAGGIKVIGEAGEFITLKPDDYYSFADFTSDVVNYGFDGSGRYWTDEILPGLRKSDFVDPITGELVYSPASIVVGSFEQMGQIVGAALGTYGLMGMGMVRNAAVVTPMFMATYENNVQLAKDLGYEGSSATSAGILFSMIEGYSELIFPDIDFFSSAAKKEAFKMFLDNFSKGGARMAVTRFMETTGKEIGEEYVVELGKLLATASTTFLPGSTNNIYQLDPAQLLETTIFTFTSAGAGAAVQSKLTTSKRFNDSMMFRMAQDLETSVPMIQQYNQLGKIDNKKSEQLIKSLKVISAVQGQLPNDISTPKRVVISSLYAQISALEEKIQDPNITEEIRDSYKNSIKKLKDYITMVMLADDAEFTKSYNADVEAQGKQVAEEVKKEHPDLGVAYSYLGGEKMEVSQEDQTRAGILNDIFGDSLVQRNADALEQRMKNAEEIPVEEINSVIDGLYAQLESIMNNYFDNPVGKQYAQAILDKIDKLNNYEFATGTKTDVITERKAVQTARAAVEKEVGVIQSASGVSTKAGKPNKNAKVTFENGESGLFTIRISDQGVVTFEPMSGAPVEMGPASEVNKSIQLVDMKMASNGMPSSITFSMQGVGSERGRKTVTVSIANGYNQNELLDLAINLRAKEVGTVDPTAFDEAFEEVTREVETKTYPNMPAEPQAAKEGVTQTQPQDAVQVETAGQVPVQPEAGARQEVAQGEPQAEPQAPTQESEQITDQEYDDFVNNGNITDFRIASIANKIKNSQELNEREKSMFAGSTTAINAKLNELHKADLKTPTVEKRQPRPSAQTLREAAARERLDKATQNLVKSFEGSGITVNIIEDEAEYDAIVGDSQGRSNGVFNAEDGRVIINPKRMNLAIQGNRVLFHESSHPVLNILYNTNRALYDKVLNGMKDSGKKGLPIWQDLLNFGKRYVDAGYSPEQVDNEILTEAIGRIINGEIKLNDIPVGWRQAFIDMLNKIAKMLGIKPIGAVTDAGKFRDFAASLKDVFEQGRSIAEIVGSENITKYQSPFISNQLSMMGIDQQQFLDKTTQMAQEVEGMVIPGSLTNGWIQTGTKNGVPVVKFVGEATLENIRANALDSYVNRAYELAQYPLSGIDVKGEFIKKNKLDSLDDKTKKLFEKSFVHEAKKSMQKILDGNKLDVKEKDSDEIIANKKKAKAILKSLVSSSIDINTLYDSLVELGNYNENVSTSLITSLYQKREFVYDDKVKEKIAKWKDQKKRGIREGKWVDNKIAETVFAKRNAEVMANEAESIYNDMKQKVKDNLKFIYDLVNPAIRNLTKLWYDGANVIAQEFGLQYELSLEQTAGIIASQSPQMPWFSNLHLAQAIMDIMKNKGGEVFTKEQFDYYVNSAKKYPKQIAYIPTVKSLIGKRLDELSDYDAGIFVRSYYDLNMSRKAPKRLPSGVIVSYETNDSSFSSYDTIEKGVSIFRNGSTENISVNLGEANKVRNFYNNIVDPTNINSVTIDTHAMAVSLIMPFGASDTEIKFDSGSYAFYSDSYNELARELGIGARELQSITWEAIRAFFPDNIKTSKFKAEIGNIWKRYSVGEISIGQARNEILNKGKDANKTEWSDSIQDWMDGKTGSDYFRPIDRKGDVPGTVVGRGGKGIGGGVSPMAGTDIRQGRDILGRKPGVKPQPSLMAPKGLQFSLADNQMTVEKPGMDTLKAANLSASEVANWRKQNKVSQREGRVTEVQQSAQDLADGKKTIYEHIETVKKAQPTRKTTSLKPMPSVKDVVSALADNQVKTGVIGLNVAIPKGTKVGSRLDIPSFNNYGINVVSVHDGSASGTSIGYGRAVSLSDVTFKTSPSQALNVATGASKGTFSRMMGTWNNESEESVYKRAKEALNDPNYIQIGTNPFRHSWFYDKNTGMPVMSASEILQVGNVVLAKDARVLDLTNAKDKAEFEDKFKVKLKSGKMSQFSLAAPNTVEGMAKALDEFGKNNKGGLEKLFVENRKYGKPLTISIQDGEDTIEIVFTNTEPKSNEPYAVQLSDGWPSVRRSDGTYSDGDLIYESWDDYLKQNEEAGNIDDGFKELEQNREIEVRSRSKFDKLDDFDSYSEIGFWNKATQILGDYLGYASPMQAVEESSIDSEILNRLTAKAVDLRKNGKVSDTYEFYKNVLELSDKDAKKRSEQNSLSNVIALEYYNAKQNGSNPELVKAVEDVIGKSKPQFSLTADPAQVEDVSKKAKRAFPKGQFSMLESTVFMKNPSDVAQTQYPLYQAMMQLASDAFDNGARDIEAFKKYAADIQWPDELSRNYHTQTVWDDIIRIKQGKKPLINSQADYEKMLRNKAKSNASNLKEIAMKRTRKVKEVAKKWFFDSRAAWFNALARQSDSLFDLVAAYTDTIGGMTEKGLYQADMFMSTTYDGLSQIENIPFYGQMYSERRMFDEMLTLIGYMETNRKMEDKFDELIQLETAYLNETDPNKKAVLKDKRDYVKDYLDRNKVLVGNGKTIPYSLKEFTRSNLNMASAEKKLTELSLAYPDVFDKLYKRADAYFAAWNTLLGMRLDAGMLSQESYDEMTKYKYVPTRFLGYLLMEVSDETDAKLPEATSDQIERLRGGSEEQLVMAYDESLRFASLSVTRSIQKNKAIETLSRAIDANPNQVTFFKPEVSKRDRFGNAVEWVYDKKNFGLIKYYVDGKIEAIATEQAVADAFNGRQEQFQMPEGLGYIFMSTPFRMVTTNLNPGFGLAQIVIDLNQALLTNDAYMSITTGALPLLLKDIKLLGGLYLGRASKMMGLNFNLDKEWNELFTEAREYGALISFTQAETFESALEKASKAKTRLSNVGNAFSKGREKIEKLNTSMEYVTRLAIFGKMKKDLINEYKKNNNGQKPTGQAYDDILTKAASTSMNMLNYNRGGSVIKPLNRVMAYLNVGFQVPYSIYQYAKKSPYLFTLKVSELAVYGVLVGIMLYQMLDDDDKDKYLEYYNRLSAFEKSNYWHYPNPFKNPDDPDTWLLRFKKPTILLPIVNTTEVYAMYYITNGKTQKPDEYLNANPLKQDQYTATIGRDMYEAQPFKGGIISSMPTVNAAAIGFGNMDLYRMENVVPDADIKANPREGLEDPRVGQFFKYVSQIGVESPYLVDGPLSPKRMDASVKALIGDYSRNPVTAYPLYVAGAMMNGLSGYRDAGKYVPAEPEKHFIDKLIEGSGITQRFTTRIPEMKPVTKKKMEFQKMEKNAIYDTIGFTIEQAVQEGMKPSKEDIRMYFKDMNLNQEGMFAVEDYEKILNNAFKYAQKVDKIKEVENKYTWVKRFVLTPSNVDKLIIWESETSDYSYEQKFEALKWLVKNDLFIPKKEMPKNKTTLDEKLVEDLKKLRYL